MPDREWERESPAFGELLASCAAADAVSRPPESPAPEQGLGQGQEQQQQQREQREREAA